MKINKIKIDKARLKQFLLLVFGVLILFFSYKYFEVIQINQINSISELNIINEKTLSSKDLFLNAWSVIKNNYYKSNLNNQNWNKWKKKYITEIKTDEDAYVAINSMLASINDPYSKFLSKEEFNEQNSAINSKVYGIGINITSVSGKTVITNVLENTPAFNSGIKPNDIILKVNKVDVNGQSVYQVARLIRGDLKENIELELLRGNNKFTKNIKREEIKVKTIEAKNLTDDIGYIRISSFIGLDVAQDFIIALNKLKQTKGLILDIRGNSGGLFQNAIVISNLFMKEGVIVKVIARQNKNNIYMAKDEGCIYDNPLIILVDETTASASEILASALQENKRAILVGTNTYGKGLVQKVFSLPNKTGMNLTIARYLTPNGTDINKNGIKPDYTVLFSHSDFINNTDSQIEFAKKLLEEKIR